MVDDPTFPAMAGFPAAMTVRDEHYQLKNFSRDKLRVLARLDPAKRRSQGAARPSHRRGFPGGVGEDVWQGTRLLLHARPFPGSVGCAGRAADVLRSHSMDARAERGRRESAALVSSRGLRPRPPLLARSRGPEAPLRSPGASAPRKRSTRSDTPSPPARRERAQRSEPRDRSAPTKRRARARAGESEGRSPSVETSN